MRCERVLAIHEIFPNLSVSTHWGFLRTNATQKTFKASVIGFLSIVYFFTNANNNIKELWSGHPALIFVIFWSCHQPYSSFGAEAEHKEARGILMNVGGLLLKSTSLQGSAGVWRPSLIIQRGRGWERWKAKLWRTNPINLIQCCGMTLKPLGMGSWIMIL